MNGKPDNLTAMIVRALAAQAEMGIGEVVVGPAAQAPSHQTAQLLARSDRVVSVGEAIAASGYSAGPAQESLLVSSMPEYDSLDEHRAAICECQKCPLGKTRTKFVYGQGDPEADIMFVGEAPGQREDQLGEPFVGRAGQLLDKILAAMHLDRSQVYIANILKCRPPANRDPQADEMEQCFPYLKEQIRIIKPKVMCALGRISAQALLESKSPLGKLRGTWHSYENVPLIVSYHPAALLRNPNWKHGAWEDMQELLRHYESLK